MKNWKKYLAIVLMICFVVTLAPLKAHADALTIGMIGAATFAIGTSLGITWAMGNMTGSSVGQYIEGKITDWMDGSTIAEKFGTEAMRVAAGKLVVPATIYNGIVNFLNDYKEETEEQAEIGILQMDFGTYKYLPGGIINSGENVQRAVYYEINTANGSIRTAYGGEWGPIEQRQLTNDGMVFDQDDGKVYGVYSFNYAGSRKSDRVYVAGPYSTQPKTVSVDSQSYTTQQAIADNRQWEGDFSDTIGLQNPPESVADFYPRINDAIADNGLDVVGDVTDESGTVEPVPTEAPVYPPIDDVLGGLGQIEGTLDGIQDTVGSIDQALEGVGENVGEIEQTITEALEVPEAEDVELHKFDLKGLFPFCIPFDLHAIISAFSRDPVTPSVSIPFNIPMIGLEYTFNLDLHDFDGLAQVLRTLEFIAFGVGLLFVTGKVIKW